MGLKVTTDGRPVTVFRQDKTSAAGNAYTTYALGISSKDMDGNWVNGFVDARFKSGVDVANKRKITINNAFYTVKESNGKSYVSIMVTDFDIAENGQPATNNSNTDFMNIPDGVDEELPFV